MKRLSPGTRKGEVDIPSSKSAAHRLLICAAVGQKPVRIALSGLSDDILATIFCLRQFGADIQNDADGLTVQPITDIPEKEIILPCGESGSTLRFLLPLAGALGISACFLMEGRLSARPMAGFEALLESGGMNIERCGKALHCSGKLRNGNYAMRGDISSQYFSGLLMSLPLLSGNSTLSVTDKLESEGYLRLTEYFLRKAGIVFEKTANGWLIPGRQKPQLPANMRTEGDWSGAAFYLGLGAFSKSGIRLNGLDTGSYQGDRAILQILEEYGANIDIIKDQVMVRSGDRKPMTIDASPIPDLIPVLAVLACAAEGVTYISNAERLRYKESDRLRAVSEMIRNLGGIAEELRGGLIIKGTGRLYGGTVDSLHDHRIAMSAAIASSFSENEVQILHEDCVKKSYPGFWEDFEGLEIE